MSNKMNKVVLSVLLASGIYSTSSWAEDPFLVATSQSTAAVSDKMDKLLTLFTNYSSYFYIDPTNPWSNRNNNSNGNNLPSTFDINDISSAGQALVFNSIYMNPLLGTVFSNFQNQGNGGNIGVNPTVDQPFPGTSNYASNPVTQIILNNLNTAIDEFDCYDPSCLTGPGIVFNILGTDFLSQPAATARPITNLSQSSLDQMNLDSLLAPITYTTTSPSLGTGSPFGGNPQNTGLSTSNQAQLANNFIRYVSANILPMTLPTLKTFRDYMTTWQDTTKDQPTRLNARLEIVKLISGLRTNTALMSVGLSNLYHSFARRMPNSATQNKSELQVEYEMATRRLFNPAQGSADWHQEMEKADITTLLREINYTLSEINYQLFLNRQMMERNMAATSTMVLEQQQFVRSLISGDSAIQGMDFNIPAPKPSF